MFVNEVSAIYDIVEMKDLFDRYDFAVRLKEARLHRGLSMKEVAERVGVTASAVAYYESGERVPRLPVLGKLASEFSVTIDHLVGRAF